MSGILAEVYITLSGKGKALCGGKDEETEAESQVTDAGGFSVGSTQVRAAFCGRR